MKSRYIFVGIALLLIMSTLSLPSFAVKLNHAGTRIRSFATNLLHAEEKQREIERLQDEIAGLAKQLLYQGYAQKQESLQEAEKILFSDKSARIIMSSVIGKGFLLGSQILILNKGTNAGIIEGEAVVTSQENADKNGLILIGRIASVFSDRSYALLLTDASFEIPAKLVNPRAVIPRSLPACRQTGCADERRTYQESAEPTPLGWEPPRYPAASRGDGFIDETGRSASSAARAGLKGKVKGGIGDRVTLEGITQGFTIKEGDLIITDNDNPQIPPGIVIGYVEKILSILTDTAQKAGVHIFFDPGQLDFVGVVKAVR